MSTIRPAAVAGLFYPGEQTELARELLGYAGQTRDAAARARVPEGADRAARRLHLLRPGRGARLRAAAAGAGHREARGAARAVPPRRGARARAAGGGGVRDAARQRPDRRGGGGARSPALPQVVDQRRRRTRASTRSRCSCRSCSRCCASSSWCRWWSAPRAREEVAQVVDRLWGGPETLIVISSDLSHYHSYEAARAIDGRTVQAILDFRTDIDHEQACGATPVTGFLLAAKRRGLTRRAPRRAQLRRHRRRPGPRGRLRVVRVLGRQARLRRSARPDAARPRARRASGNALGERVGRDPGRAVAEGEARDLRDAQAGREAARLHRQPAADARARRGRGRERRHAALADRRFSPLGARRARADRDGGVAALRADAGAVRGRANELHRAAASRRRRRDPRRATGGAAPTCRRSGSSCPTRCSSSRASSRRPASRPTRASPAARCGATRSASGRNRTSRRTDERGPRDRSTPAAGGTSSTTGASSATCARATAGCTRASAARASCACAKATG